MNVPDPRERYKVRNTGADRAHDIQLIIYITTLCACFISPAAHTADDADAFNADFEEQIADVNEGALEFLPSPPEKNAHQHNNRITITTNSLQSGWATVSQCHQHIDAINNVQISYNKDTTRDLRISSFHNIGRAWIEAGNVELRDVAHDASVCMEFNSEILHFDDDTHVRMRTGPYMRRFLDGYYPMNVRLDVDYPCDALRFSHANYPLQPGYTIEVQPCKVSLDTWFRGKLVSELFFTRNGKH